MAAFVITVTFVVTRIEIPEAGSTLANAIVVSAVSMVWLVSDLWHIAISVRVPPQRRPPAST
ncbi:MAG: hypothetical protein IPG63_14170 [Xanthomonadales bacterium]|jgi:hypothetical protein|nr:hypothetical protein [Xanthomonadales bacterium]MCC6562824.1 hypothetical protein [Xanthomonadales bacterium]